MKVLDINCGFGGAAIGLRKSGFEPFCGIDDQEWRMLEGAKMEHQHMITVGLEQDLVDYQNAVAYGVAKSGAGRFDLVWCSLNWGHEESVKSIETAVMFRPIAIVFEMRQPENKTITHIMQHRKLVGYQSHIMVMDAADYGSPTHRKRTYLIMIDVAFSRISHGEFPYCIDNKDIPSARWLDIITGRNDPHCFVNVHMPSIPHHIARHINVANGEYFVGQSFGPGMNAGTIMSKDDDRIPEFWAGTELSVIGKNDNYLMTPRQYLRALGVGVDQLTDCAVRSTSRITYVMNGTSVDIAEAIGDSLIRCVDFE